MTTTAPRRGAVSRRWRATRRTAWTRVKSAPAAGVRAVQSRTTHVRCPWCETRPMIREVDWNAHFQAHAAASTRAQRNRQQVDRVRARQADRDWRESRPVNHQARARMPIHPMGGGTRPTPGANGGPRVRWVDDTGNPTDWRPGDPYPDSAPEPAQPPASDSQARWPRLAAFLAWLWPSLDSTPAASDGGKRWNDRTHNPGETPVGGTGPVAPVVPIRPTSHEGDPTVSETPSGTSTTRRRAASKPKAPSGSAGSSANGAQGIAEGGQAWARSIPPTLQEARFDAQAITEALAGLADSMLQRMNAETERAISPACVEPYQGAAQDIRAAAEKCQEVHNLLLRRYGPVAEELAKPDTPHPDYLVEGT